VRHHDSADNDTPVVLPRREVKSLYRAVLALLLAVAVALAPIAYFAIRQDATNEHLDDTDDRLVALIEAEEIEDAQEDALACSQSHERYEQFLVLAEELTAAGGRIGARAHLRIMGTDSPEARAQIAAEIDRTLAEEIAPLLERYPPPNCDLAHARMILDEYGPPDVPDEIPPPPR